MFDIGWSEMAIIALVALVVIGPKDLPRTMKTIAQWMRKARSLTREFQSGIDEMVREAELEDARKALEETRRGNFEKTISNAIDPDDEVGSEVRAVESEARRESAAPAPAAGKAEGGATMIQQPANVAPPHSIKPPAETAAPAPAGEASSSGGNKASPATGGEDSKQSA